MKSHQSYGQALAGSAMKHAAIALVLLLAAAALAPRAMAAPIFLDTNNPLANFVRDGNQGAAPGGQLVLSDASGTDHIGFYGATSVAAAGSEVDLTATVRLLSQDLAAGVDTGMRLVITDGAVTSFIAGFVTLGGIPGVAIAIGSNFADAGNWAGFVPMDWLNENTLRIRRHADGSGEIVEVNGAAPLASTLVPAASLPGPMTGFASVGFGLFADAALTAAEITHFSAATPVPEPQTCALMLAALGLLAITARRRKQEAAPN